MTTLFFSQQQMQAMDAIVMQAFVQRTLAHLKQYFPGHCSLLGDAQMGQVIRHGHQQAERHGLSFECCVRTYIEFMCLLGSGFDEDPLLPWARDILSDTTSIDQVARGDRLYDRAFEYIHAIKPDYRHPNGEPRTARFMADLRDLMRLPDRPMDAAHALEVQHRFAHRLAEVFPAKVGVVGEPALCAALAQSAQRARSLGLQGERGFSLVSTLMFLLGPAFQRDPLLPWVAASLTESKNQAEGVRVDHLGRQAVHTLRRWWAIPHD